jgi:hypothetical protein
VGGLAGFGYDVVKFVFRGSAVDGSGKWAAASQCGLPVFFTRNFMCTQKIRTTIQNQTLRPVEQRSELRPPHSNSCWAFHAEILKVDPHLSFGLRYKLWAG